MAQKDLRQIWDFFENAASVGIADKIYFDVVNAANLVKERPQLGRPRDDIKQGYRSIRASPFLVYYLVNDQEVRILRILHERRSVRKALRER